MGVGDMRCSCTIHDVRREQILESSGRHWIRLVCNVCETILDEGPADVRERERVRATGNLSPRGVRGMEQRSHEQ